MAFALPRTDDIDVTLLSSIVHNCIQEDKLSKLKATLKKFTHDQRKRIVQEKVNGNAPLFTACLQGKVHFVNFLLDECNADVEQHGIYEVEEDRSRHEVTPLWCASVGNKMEVVKTLIHHGANVNSPSDTDSTPVRSACYMTNIAVIKYLVDHGADIHKPNVNGGTCLINSVQSPHLCDFLIMKGANVNARDNSGNLALHYAIREGRLETVKLLLKHGANHTTKNCFGDDALQTAALRGYVEIVNVILQETKQSYVNAIHAYELLGTNYIDEKNDISEALKVWKKAMSMRFQNLHNPISKVLPTETNYAYNHAREPTTVEEMKNLIDPESIHMQALLIRERILGPHHKDTTFGLMYRGAVYADSHRYQRCVDLWKYAFILRHEKGEPLNPECLFTIQALVKLFWEIQVEVESGATDEKVRFKDAVEVFDILVQQIHAGKVVISSPSLPANAIEDFQLILQLSLHLIHLISRLNVSDTENIQFFRLVHKVVSLDPRGQHAESLLHLAVDPKISLTSEEFFSPFPSLSVIEVLLKCGAEVNSVDDKNSTPLHKAVKLLTYSELQEEGILKCLLDNGAHVDMFNCEGQSALAMLKNQGLPICPLNYVTLRCLSAAAVVRSRIPFEEDIPTALIPFVKMHGI
ncbi:hypothetical protein CHS0354_035158 [Potamilus streckersoni]|uniref:Uncharacterized protein n=1 Tax=Potamilus streckersoni TaxID=2493646 RepID=A0AAE0TGG9_9BIVA|nr:hypothetical protein CHS0354_035158 [Potamilus streckersoni]